MYNALFWAKQKNHKNKVEQEKSKPIIFANQQMTGVSGQSLEPDYKDSLCPKPQELFAVQIKEGQNS